MHYTLRFRGDECFDDTSAHFVGFDEVEEEGEEEEDLEESEENLISGNSIEDLLLELLLVQRAELLV